MGRPRLNVSGQRFGRLVALRFIRLDKRRAALWKCRCRCGKTVAVHVYALRNKQTRSCGCLARKTAAELLRGNSYSLRHGQNTRKHGPTGLYSVYYGMLDRCRNPRSTAWKDYGGRGIRVCNRWQGPRGFQNFLADMQPRPRGKSLDRKRVNGIYSPRNCRWATKHQQALNRRPRLTIQNYSTVALLTELRRRQHAQKS